MSRRTAPCRNDVLIPRRVPSLLVPHARSHTTPPKERFDEEGHGRGLAGRDSAPKGGGHPVGHAGMGDGPVDLASIVDRSPADKRGVKVEAGSAPAAHGSPKTAHKPAAKSSASTTASGAKASPKGTRKADSGPKPTSVREVFDKYTAFGHTGSAGELDSSKFAKLCKESKLVGKQLSITDVDLIFTKACPKGVRRLDWAHFNKALDMVAESMKLSKDEVEKRLLSTGGPAVSGTHVAANSIVDRLTDTSEYTGSHRERFDSSGKGRGKAGHDTATGGVADLSQLVDRSPADVRGRKT